MKYLTITIICLTIFSIGARADQALETEIEKIKVGMSSDEVLKIAGKPAWRGKTFLDDVQWDYVLPNTAKSRIKNNERKIWIVYDANKKVKEVWRYRACHLGIEPTATKKAEQNAVE